jgi:ABC-type lipoprotein export system ATPase subunit
MATKEILKNLIKLNQKSNITLIIASHNHLLSDISDKTIFLKDGNIVNQKQAGY